MSWSFKWANRPTTASAMKLAREHASYCDEIGTALAAHAGTLKNGTVWFFWWD